MVLLATTLIGCGGDESGAGAGSGSAAGAPAPSTPSFPTDPAKLPNDEAGLVKHYVGLMTEVVTTLEGIDTEEQLTKGLDHVESLGPAFAALMKKSDSLESPVDEGGRPEVDALMDRMQTASQALLEKFPKRAMEMMNAFASMTGGVQPR